jgi:hypothetical protein
MADEPGRRGTDLEQIAAGLQARLENERAAGAYADDLSGIELQVPGEETGIPSPVQGPAGQGPRVRFRPELGFSSKPAIGPVITQIKRFILRLQFHVLDDLARQTDAAITRIERALEVEIATRERLERELDDKLRLLEDKERAGGDPGHRPQGRAR